MKETAKSNLWKQVLVALPPLAAIGFLWKLSFTYRQPGQGIDFFEVFLILMVTLCLAWLVFNAVVKAGRYGIPRKEPRITIGFSVVILLFALMKIWIAVGKNDPHPMDSGVLFMILAFMSQSISTAMQAPNQVQSRNQIPNPDVNQ